jgi:hypothetical protein
VWLLGFCYHVRTRVFTSWGFRQQEKIKRFEHPAFEVGRGEYHQVGREFKERWFIKEALNPNIVKSLSHIEEKRALPPLFSEFPYYSLNVEGQLHRNAVLWV